MPMASAAATFGPIVSLHRSGAQPLPWGARALRRGGVPTELTLLVFVFACGSALPLLRSKWPHNVTDKAAKIGPRGATQRPAPLAIAGPEHQPHHQQQAGGAQHRLDPVSISYPKHCQG